MIEVSVEELVGKMLSLQIDETLDFFQHGGGDSYGITKVRHFNISMLLINCYKHREPFVIALDEDVEADQLRAQVLNRFTAYCAASGIDKLHISPEPKVDALCPEAQEMRSRKKNALLSKDALMNQLSEGGYTDRMLSEIRDEYMDALGFDPIWRYPFYHDGKLGAVMIPVTEGFLWLPYSIIDIEDNEKYEPENSALLDANTCEWLIEEMGRYTEPLTAVMRYVANELKETETLTMGGRCDSACSLRLCPL